MPKTKHNKDPKVYGAKEDSKKLEKLEGRDMINKLAVAKKVNEIIEFINSQ